MIVLIPFISIYFLAIDIAFISLSRELAQWFSMGNGCCLFAIALGQYHFSFLFEKREKDNKNTINCYHSIWNEWIKIKHSFSHVFEFCEVFFFHSLFLRYGSNWNSFQLPDLSQLYSISKIEEEKENKVSRASGLSEKRKILNKKKLKKFVTN